MHDPIDLPRELFDQILDEASDNLTDAKPLYNLALVSRQWHSTSTPHFYSKWTYFGATHSHRSLLYYLRTLVQHPELAARVRALDVRNWWHYSEDYRDAELPECEYSKEEIVMVRTALRDAHFTGPEWDEHVDKALERKQRRLLMALVFTRLPQLEKLHVHLSREDRFLNRILQVATNRERDGRGTIAFQALKEATLLNGEVPPHKSKSMSPVYTINLDEAAPFFLLPSIESLAFLELDNLTSYSFGERSLPLKRLIIDGASDCAMTRLQTFMKAFVGLQSFTLHEERSEGIRGRCNNYFIGDMGDALRLQRDTLEHIDIRRTKAFCAARQHQDPATHVLGSLGGFPRLKSLSIQPEALVGGGNGKLLAPYRLATALPPSIESLCFVVERKRGPVSPDSPCWTNQLLELVDMHSHSFPNLKFVAVQSLGLPDDRTMMCIEGVGSACRRKGLAFSFGTDVPDWRDSSCFDYFREEERWREERDKVVD